VVQDIVPAIKAFGLLGGLGARKRRGWGSVALLSLEGVHGWTPPTSREDYIEKVKEVLGKRLPVQSGSNFLMTAFAKETDIRVGIDQNANALKVLNDLGEGFQRYRAWGHNGTAGGKPSEMNFKEDHDWYKKTDKFSRERGNYVPERTAFGLPHNYAQNFGVTATGGHDRRASPLMFHIHKAAGQCFPVAIFFPTQFLNDAYVEIGGAPNTFRFDPNTISSFLKNTRPDGSRPPNGDYFPNTEVFP